MKKKPFIQVRKPVPVRVIHGRGKILYLGRGNIEANNREIEGKGSLVNSFRCYHRKDIKMSMEI